MTNRQLKTPNFNYTLYFYILQINKLIIRLLSYCTVYSHNTLRLT